MGSRLDRQLLHRRARARSSTASRAPSRARSRPPSGCKSHGILVEELNNVDDLPVYIDGADEVDRARRDDQGRRRRAHAREDRRRGRAQVRLHRRRRPSWSTCSAAFRCRSRSSRWRAATSRASWCALRRRSRRWRMGFTTDNGNVILDVDGPAHHRSGRARDRRSTRSPAWSPSACSRAAAPTSCWSAATAGVTTLTPKR